MFKSVGSIEKKIKRLQEEVNSHAFKKKTTRIPAEIKIHEMRRRAAEEALTKARADLILAKAEESAKAKKKAAKQEKKKK